jgi:hypothetical protein
MGEGEVVPALEEELSAELFTSLRPGTAAVRFRSDSDAF